MLLTLHDALVIPLAGTNTYSLIAGAPPETIGIAPLCQYQDCGLLLWGALARLGGAMVSTCFGVDEQPKGNVARTSATNQLVFIRFQ
jgi:hypothetical protein